MKTTMQITNGVSTIAMTAAERAAGRFMRSPDHDAGTAGEPGGNTNGDGTGGSDGAAGSAARADGGAQGAAGSGDQGAGDAKGGDEGGDGKPAGNADRTILGDAAQDEGEGSGKPEGAEGDGEGGGDKDGEGSEGPRLTFGESEDAQAPILGSPEAYDLKAPEGMEFDTGAFEAVEETLRGLNLSNEAAQEIVNAYSAKIIPMMQERAAAAGDTQAADMRRTWTQESESTFDGKEGRPSFNEAKALSKQAFLKFGVGGKEDDPFLTLLEESGLGSHPVMLATFANIGRAVGEGAIEPGGGSPAPARLADRIYGQPIKPG